MSISDTSPARTLDSDLLRTFLAIADAGSFTHGAQRIFRSQSAASLQIKQLEEILGQQVFDRHGRGVVLSPAGEKLAPVARQVVDALDRSLAELAADPLEGLIRIGIPDDFGQSILTRVMAEFCRTHPRVEVSVRCGLSAGFPDALAARGELDVAAYAAEEVPRGGELLLEERTLWATSRQHRAHEGDPLPVVLFDRECWWRDRALETLKAWGRPFRIAYSSESVAGVVAAIEAGAAVGLLGESTFTAGLAKLTADQGFDDTQTSKLVLDRRPGSDGPVTEAMTAAIRRAFADA